MGEAYSLEEHQLVCAPVLPLTKKKKGGGNHLRYLAVVRNPDCKYRHIFFNL